MSGGAGTATRKRTVLLIANVFHASPRIPAVARYLPRYGWEPILLTVPTVGMESQFGAPPADLKEYCRVVETAGYRGRIDAVERAATGIRDRFYVESRLWKVLRACYRFSNRLYRQVYRLYYELRWFPDEEKNWVPLAVRAGRELIGTARIDAIITSSSPVSCHLVGRALKREFGIPWVADLRDLWTQNHNYTFSPIRKMIEQRLERATLGDADHLVTVTPPWSQRLRVYHGTDATSAIPNGFEEHLLAITSVPQSVVFRMAYTGLIYAKRQNPDKVLGVLADLFSVGALDRARVSLDFYGRTSSELEESIKWRGLTDVVHQNGVRPREEVARLQRECHVLLLLNWEDPAERGWYPLKLFEYLAARRPVLASGGHGADLIEDLLRSTNSGWYCREAADVSAALERAYAAFCDTGTVPYAGRIEEIKKYSYDAAARRFAGILTQAVTA